MRTHTNDVALGKTPLHVLTTTPEDLTTTPNNFCHHVEILLVARPSSSGLCETCAQWTNFRKPEIVMLE